MARVKSDTEAETGKTLGVREAKKGEVSPKELKNMCIDDLTRYTRRHNLYNHPKANTFSPTDT